MKVAQSCPTLCDYMGYTVHGILQARILCHGQVFPSLGDLPNPGIKPRSPALQVDSLPAEPHGKLINTGVCSLSLLQQIFRIQESNQGLLHFRQILYHHDPTISLPGIYAKELQTYVHTNLYMTIDRKIIHNKQKGKQPKCPSTNGWVKKIQHIYKMEYFLTIEE